VTWARGREATTYCEFEPNLSCPAYGGCSFFGAFFLPMLAYSKVAIGYVPAGVRFDDPDMCCLHVTAVGVVEALPKRYKSLASSGSAALAPG